MVFVLLWVSGYFEVACSSVDGLDFWDSVSDGVSELFGCAGYELWFSGVGVYCIGSGDGIGQEHFAVW